MALIGVYKFDGPCPFNSCKEQGPHTHPWCRECDAIWTKLYECKHGTTHHNEEKNNGADRTAQQAG